MLSKDLQTEIMNWTVLHSGYIEKRGYIGLSEIGLCERVIYERYYNGAAISLDDHLKSRIGFEMETALIERLREMKLYHAGESIELYDGMVQGHTDGVINGDVLEIKTIPFENWFPRERKLPARVYWQVQAYLAYTERRFAHVVYLARDTGYAQVYGLKLHDGMKERIAAKLERMVEAVRELRRPECTCGRC